MGQITRYLYMCEDNHSWSIRTEQQTELSRDDCPVCGMEPVVEQVQLLADRPIITIENRAHIDSRSGELRGDRNYLLQVQDPKTGQIYRASGFRGWRELSKLINDIREMEFDRAKAYLEQKGLLEQHRGEG